MNEWIKINREKDDVPEAPFFLSDIYKNVFIGHGSFDYYDRESIYWLPIPNYPIDENES